MLFHELLKETRQNKSLLKKDVARMFGWTAMYYGRYETGDILPTQSNVQKFADFIGISKTELEDIVEYSRRKN